MAAAEAVIERRVNAFGVGEPLVQQSRSGSERRIIVELPGVKDIEQAKEMIKETPFLEFREPAGPEVQKQIDDYNAETKKKAEELLKQAKSGADFAQFAKDNSEDPGSKDQGGELDFSKKGAFVPAFDAAVFSDNFPKGSVYPELVESDFGWHIIKKIDERGEGDNREVKAAHILLTKRSLNDSPLLAYQPTGLSEKTSRRVC
ncbi:MAG: peptidylprolyl isomerase [Candidatus Moraniibacteriota bacterium]